MKIALRVESCLDCPNRRHYSGSRYKCAAIGSSPLPEDARIPAWCPLPDDPAEIAAFAIEDVSRTRRIITSLAAAAADPSTPTDRLRDQIANAAELLRR